MSIFKRKITKGFSKKKYMNDPMVCKICKNDRGMVSKTKLCYKCMYNYLNYTNFRF